VSPGDTAAAFVMLNEVKHLASNRDLLELAAPILQLRLRMTESLLREDSSKPVLKVPLDEAGIDFAFNEQVV
jgi:hypothetical protein